MAKGSYYIFEQRTVTYDGCVFTVGELKIEPFADELVYFGCVDGPALLAVQLIGTEEQTRLQQRQSNRERLR